MSFFQVIQDIFNTGVQQLLDWMKLLLPQIFLFLILLNAVTCLIGRRRVEKLAARCGSNVFLRYLVLPFLSAVVLGNPMAISMGRYLPEHSKPAYFASASYHCHTNSGVFQHINPAELFLWIGIANGVLACGHSIFPLAVRYLLAGLAANFVSGYTTEIITGRLEKRQGIRLDREVDLWTENEPEEMAEEEPMQVQMESEEMAEADSVQAQMAAAELEQAQIESEEMAEADSVPAQMAAATCAKNPHEEALSETQRYRPITIVRGDGGYGGPITVTPTEERHTVLYMIGGGQVPEPLGKILQLSGMEAVDGNKESFPDEKVALAIIDCGGTLRCGIYPGKGIPTVNIKATGKSGPLAKYMTPDLYVSSVTSHEVSAGEAAATEATAAETAAREATAAEAAATKAAATKAAPAERSVAEAETIAAVERTTQTNVTDVTDAPEESGRTVTDVTDASEESGRTVTSSEKAGYLWNKLLEPVMTVSKVISIFQQSARDAVRTCLEMILPFMGFAALFIGLCRGSGLTQFLAGMMEPMGGSLAGLMGIGILCSVPGLSAVLSAGAVAAQMFSTVVGDLIAAGSIPPAMALPALFAINCQCACDFIPVGLGMEEAKPETVQVGIAAVTISRFVTGWIRILIAVVFSIGLYR